MKDYAFGNLITSLRTTRGYSQFQLGTMLGVSDKAISKWENGDAKPRLATCGRLAEILGVSVNELLTAANASKNDGAVQEAVNMHEKQTTRIDLAYEKRVELHLHTGMSGKNGIDDINAYLMAATDWGHSAIAVTDCGVTYAFSSFVKQAQKKKIKPILGCELWMIPDEKSGIQDGVPVMALVKNRQGLINLNRIVTESHIRYLKSGKPCVPKALLTMCRNGLMIGAACNDGEVVRVLQSDVDREQAESITEFYDYLEVQPPEYACANGQNEERIRKMIQDTVMLGSEKGIPVVAVGNVQFLDPEESILYNAMQYMNGETDCTKCVPFYYRTTEEMLQAFDFLDADIAKQIVVDNTRQIADNIEDDISLYPPVSEGRKRFYPVASYAEDELQRIAGEQAYAIYGSPLPQEVRARLEQELRIIGEKQYGTLYMAVRSIKQKSVKDGYPVTCRGSMASSFVTMLCGITDINPLPPHYRCPDCKTADFHVDTRVYTMGMDLPERSCPICGKPMLRDGFNLPFETFLGQHGERIPDFVLNIAPEYQEKALRHAAGMFGKNHGLFPSTITGYSEQIIGSAVTRYAEDHDLYILPDRIQRYQSKARSILKYIGKHPGGIFLIPPEYEPEEFTPIQYPSNDTTSAFPATHYEFRSIGDTLVKLDLLSHDTPELLQRLNLMIDMDFESIPLNDPRVIALFSSTQPLDVDRYDILSKCGTYGIPEFDSETARKLLVKQQPKTFSELVNVVGIMHGTGIWEDNFEVLVKSGVAAFSECPAHREDIMNKLLAHGFDRDTAYQTMESVRKGHGIPDNIAARMRGAGIPNWYINACGKIGYLFPKAHTAAYVAVSVRLAWVKLYRPHEFYTALMDQICMDMDIGDLSKDMATLRRTILSLRNDEQTPYSDNSREKSLELILEMRARGISPVPEIPNSMLHSNRSEDDGKALAKYIIEQNSPLVRSLMLFPKEERMENADLIEERVEMGLTENEDISLYLEHLKEK